MPAKTIQVAETLQVKQNILEILLMVAKDIRSKFSYLNGVYSLSHTFENDGVKTDVLYTVVEGAQMSFTVEDGENKVTFPAEKALDEQVVRVYKVLQDRQKAILEVKRNAFFKMIAGSKPS